MLTREALHLLAGQIGLARKCRRMSEQERASRIGVARSTLQLIDMCNPSVAIGLVPRAAARVRVDRFLPEATLAPRLQPAGDNVALMPGSIQRSAGETDDGA